MFTFRRISLTCAVVAALAFAGSAPQAQTAAAGTQTRPAAAPQATTAGHITSPKEEWGHNVGDDYFLANYQQLIAYWHKLEKESNRRANLRWNYFLAGASAWISWAAS